ncbi:MAG: stage II sporulation protein M [Clostridia bacterium]|nr:stage II sporulation protein M [Clostridia bacterium]
MKKLLVRKSVSEYLIRNKWQILIVFASLFAGIIIGSFFSVNMTDEKNNAITKYIQNFVSAYGFQTVNGKDIFKFSIYNNIKVILFLWISGLWIGFLPVGILQTGLKGYKIGFSATLFIKIFGFKGIVFALLTILPQFLVMIPAIILYFVFNINFAFSIHNLKNQKLSGSVKNQLYVKNLIFFLVMIVISIVSGLIDAYVMPPILKPVCSFLNK